MVHKILDFCTAQAKQQLINRLEDNGWSAVVRVPDLDSVAIYVTDLESGHLQMVTVDRELLRNPDLECFGLPIDSPDFVCSALGGTLLNTALASIVAYGKNRNEVQHQSEEAQTTFAAGASLYLIGTDTYQQWKERGIDMSFFIVRMKDDSGCSDFLFRPFALVIPDPDYLFEPRIVLDMVVKVLKTDRQNGTGFYRLQEKASVTNIDDYR